MTTSTPAAPPDLRTRLGPAADRLTPREFDAVSAVASFKADHGGRLPTFQEVGDVLGVSRISAHEYLHNAAAKGALVRVGGKSRIFDVADHSGRAAALAEVGRIIGRARVPAAPGLPDDFPVVIELPLALVRRVRAGK